MTSKPYPARFISDKILREQGPPEIFDNTILSQYEECPRKLYWFLRGILPSEEPIWFVSGRAWQRALVEWYSNRREIELIAGGDAEGTRILTYDALLQCYTKIDLEFSESKVSLESLHDEKRNPENLKKLLDKYISEFPSEPWNTVEMEIGFTMEFENTPFMLGGALDGYIEWPKQGLFVLENKTTASWLNDRYRKQWHRDHQITQYFWALQQLVENASGVLMNHASLDIPKRSSTQRELFMRHLEYRSKTQMEQFSIRTKGLLYRIENEWGLQDKGLNWTPAWPCHGQMCHGKLAFSPCLYVNLCDSDIPFTELNPMNYPGFQWRQEPWEPWKREE